MKLVELDQLLVWCNVKHLSCLEGDGEMHKAEQTFNVSFKLALLSIEVHAYICIHTHHTHIHTYTYMYMHAHMVVKVLTHFERSVCLLHCNLHMLRV